MRLKVRVEGDKITENAFKQARREVNKRVKTGVSRAADTAVKPRLLAFAPSITRPYLTTKATSRRAMATTRGSKKGDRIVGLLNFGGTRRDHITPKKGRAVSTPQGPRAAVRGPRRYRGKHFIERAVRSSVPRFTEIVADEVMKSFGQLPRSK